MSAKRQVVPSLVDVASSADLLCCLTMADGRTKPVASNVARARTSAMDAAAAVSEETHISSVKRLYLTTSLKDFERISTPIFPPR